MKHELLANFPIHLSLQQMANPYSFITQFFEEEIDIVQAKQELQLWFRSALADECILSKDQIISLISFRDLLLPLIEASSIIDLQSNIEIITMDESELLNETNFCGKKHEPFTAWDYFPRHLSKQEYINPLLFVNKFFVFKTSNEWKTFLNELFSAAISECSIHSCSNETDILKSYEYLAKLLEALYLTIVRNEKVPSNSPLSPH